MGFQPFQVQLQDRAQRVEVDVVSNEGAVWRKAIARKASALDSISKGRTACGGQKSVIQHAKMYLLCSQQHPYHFVPPRVNNLHPPKPLTVLFKLLLLQVVFYFSNSISVSLASKLTVLGVEVEGSVVEVDDDSQSEASDSSSEWSSEEESTKELSSSKDLKCCPVSALQKDTIYLDITCMVAYVSSMTNGGAYFVFPKAIYNQQAEWERNDPAKPKLDALFGHNQLITCREALLDFQSLVETIGGPREKQRAAELIGRMRIVDNSPSVRVSNLQLSSNIKERSRIIFGTADLLQVVIVTANVGFVRSAAGQVLFKL